MENSSFPTPPQSPNPTEDKVWISREEYDRLKQQAVVASTPIPMPVQPMAAPVFGQDVPVKSQNEWWKLIVVTIIGVLTLLAFTSEYFSFLGMPLVIGLIIFAIISFGTKNKGVGGAAAGTSKMSTLAKVVIWVLVTILVLPVLGYVAMIVLLMILFGLGGGRGS